MQEAVGDPESRMLAFCKRVYCIPTISCVLPPEFSSVRGRCVRVIRLLNAGNQSEHYLTASPACRYAGLPVAFLTGPVCCSAAAASVGKGMQ